jgi:serine/threonine-protein kinase HipA
VDGPAQLAPAYDVVPLRQHTDAERHANDGAMALAVNDRYVHASLTVDDIVAEAQSWGLRDPRPHVTGLLEQVAAIAGAEEPDPRAHPEVAQRVRGFARNLLEGKAAG